MVSLSVHQQAGHLKPSENLVPRRRSGPQETGWCLLAYRSGLCEKCTLNVSRWHIFQEGTNPDGQPLPTASVSPMDCSMPDLAVPHYLLKFAQIYVNCIGDAVQLSHSLSPSSLSALNLPQHQKLFQ